MSNVKTQIKTEVNNIKELLENKGYPNSMIKSTIIASSGYNSGTVYLLDDELENNIVYVFNVKKIQSSEVNHNHLRGFEGNMYKQLSTNDFSKHTKIFYSIIVKSETGNDNAEYYIFNRETAELVKLDYLLDNMIIDKKIYDSNKKRDEKIKKEQRKYFDLFKFSCCTLSLLLTFILILDVFFEIITYERLIAIGIICVLWLIPFFSKFKIADFLEFERKINENNNIEKTTQKGIDPID